MHRVRTRRRGIIDLHRIAIGDYVILAAAILILVSLFLPWFVVPGARSQWAFTYSELAAIVVIVFFLATLFLVIYPALSPDLQLPLLPFATPLVFFFLGSVLLLLFTYELGKYDCVLCQAGGASRGFGVWIGWIASFAFIFGAVIKWGSRPTQRGEY